MAFEMPIRRGEAHHNSRLTNPERRACREAFRTGNATITDLARRHQVNPTTISRIVHRPADWLPDEK